ncbi:MAG: head-tail connector protein, partial [Ktedonobacteraceae bacterium]
MGYFRSADPQREPVELEDMKLHLRIDQDVEDDYIRGLVVAAREYVENYCRRSLITQTWELYLDHFPQEFYPIFDGWEWWTWRSEQARKLRRKNVIYLSHGDVQSITSIAYTDETDTPQTLSSDQYQLSTKGQQARLYPVPLQPWPATLA